MSFLKSLLAVCFLMSSTAMAASVECTAKLLDQKNSIYLEEKLKINNDQDGLYTASKTLGDCFFQAQSTNPTIFRLDVIHKSLDTGVSNYGGFDPKGNIIATYAKDKAQFLCMLVCVKK